MNPVAVVAIAVAAGTIALAASGILSSGRSAGFVAATLFLLTPLLWMQARSEPASLIVLPFITGWLLAVSRAQSDGSAAWPAVAGACLGAAIYTSYASVVMMPLFLLIAIGAAVHARALSARRLGVMVAAFAVALIPFAVFLARHPDALHHTVTTFHLYDADRFNLRQGLREMASWIGLTARSEVYYDYFNPAFLFLTGRVLLFPMAVLLPAGLYQIMSCEDTVFARVALGGFLAAPFAASLTAEAPTPRRILFLTPFAAVVATYGVKWLLARPFGTNSAERQERSASSRHS